MKGTYVLPFTLYIRKLQMYQRMIHGESVEDRRHFLSGVDSGTHQDADLIEKSGIQETGIDCRTADDTHAFYAEFGDEDLAGTYQVDPFFSAGNP